ncbi:MAG: hypothetical protein K9M98_07895 [Cephaloticoccus sp.]|nr:hypothetical protein [Cephaloticoccus sp.]MCF7760410.1 hypothetical protein [Cephaloticoccus sp.]
MAAAQTPDDLLYTLKLPRRLLLADLDGVTDQGDPSLPTKLLPGDGIVFDFGELLVGTISFSAKAETDVTLEIIPGEDWEEAMLVKDPFSPDHWYHQPHDHVSLESGSSTGVTPGRRAFRYVHFLNHGLTGVILREIRATLEHAPLTVVGRFECSDAMLNQAWDISRRTLQLCLQGFYEDGVKRDGMLWIGDYRVEFLCAWPIFADHKLAARSLRMIARCQRVDGALSAVALDAGGHLYPRISYMGDLSLHGGLHEWVLDNYCADFVSAIWEYVLHSGDVNLARELISSIRGVLDYLARVDLNRSEPGRNFITDNQPESKDWWGSRAALGFQLAAAFKDGAKLHDLLGDSARAEQCRAWHQTRRQETLETFGDPAEAATRDDASVDATRSWHSQTAAFQASALSKSQLRHVFDKLGFDPKVRRPMAGFQEYYLLEAWLEAGLICEALDEMRSYYGQMLRNDATTTWELVDRREHGIDHIHPAGRSHCHGWSAGPAHHLPTHILGVRPLTPGFKSVEICPRLGDLHWARGEVPTPHGNIVVDITAPLHGTITLPPGITATLNLPGGSTQLLGTGPHEFRT